MKTLIPIILALLLAFSLQDAKSQQLSPLGKGLRGIIYETTTDSAGRLYVVHGNEWTMQISRWDGISWYNYPSFSVFDYIVSDADAREDIVTGLCIYKGEIYLSGGFRAINNVPNTGSIARSDGVTWKSVGMGLQHYPDRIRKMCVYKNKLYAIGNYTGLGGSNKTRGFAFWDGQKWESDSSFRNYSLGTPTDMAVGEDNKLYVTGNFRSIKNDSIRYVGVWNGIKWDSLSQQFPGLPSWEEMEIAIGGDELIVATLGFQKSVWKFSQGRWKKIESALPGLPSDVYDIELLSNHLTYAANSFWVSSASQPNLYRLKDSVWQACPTFPINKKFDQHSIDQWPQVFNYGNKLLVTGAFMNHGLIYYRNIAVLEDSVTNPIQTWRLSSFIDYEYRCQSSWNWQGRELPFKFIDKSGNITQVYTDKFGYLEVYAPSAQFVMTRDPDEFIMNCTQDSFPLDSTWGTYRSVPLTPDSTTDYTIELSSGSGNLARKGSIQSYFITVTNNSLKYAVIRATMQYDAELTFLSSSEKSLRQSQNKLLITIPCAQFRSELIEVKFSVPLNIQTGRRLKMIARIDSFDTDIDTSNNYQDFICEVVAPMDPNNKTANPADVFYKDSKYIDYHINFENLGNSYAEKVIIRDTLDENFMTGSVRTLNSSHPYKLTIYDNVLFWEFDRIFLGGKSATPYNKGFVSYRVFLKEGLMPGTKIRNKAAIYFDVEDPILTNTAVNTMIVRNPVSWNPGNPLQPEVSKKFTDNSPQTHAPEFSALMELQVYPNPSKEMVYIQATSPYSGIIQVTDITGKTVRSFYSDHLMKAELNLSGLANGFYFIILDGYKPSKIILRKD